MLGAWAVPLLILLLGFDFSSPHFYFLNFRPQLFIAYRVQIEKGMEKKEIPPPQGAMVGSALRCTHKAAERASKEQRSEEIGSEAAVMKKVYKEAVTLKGRKKQDNFQGQRLM